MQFKNPYHEEKQETHIWEIMNSENNQNPVLKTFIDMIIDAECNETTPALSFTEFMNIFRFT